METIATPPTLPTSGHGAGCPVPPALPITAPASPSKPKPANLPKLLFFFFGSFGMGILSAIALTAGAMLQSQPVVAAGVTGYVIATILALTCTVLSYIVLFRAWTCVPSNLARATPGQAVGYLFIPFYNFYWLFQAYPGLARDYNEWADRTGSDSPRLDEKRFKTFCILILLTAIPYVGLLIGLSLIYYSPKIWKDLCEVINFHAEPETA